MKVHEERCNGYVYGGDYGGRSGGTIVLRRGGVSTKNGMTTVEIHPPDHVWEFLFFVSEKRGEREWQTFAKWCWGMWARTKSLNLPSSADGQEKNESERQSCTKRYRIKQH